MVLVRYFFPQLRSHERLSSVIPKKSIALMALAWSAFYLYLWPSGNMWWAILPFILMATKGVDVTVVNGLFLSAMWMSYMLLITCPLYPLIGRYIVLMIYLPIIGVVFYKEPHQKADPLFLFISTVFWDFPLICWMRVISWMGGRALKPFYSQITDEIAVGSMPLEVDTKHLAEVENIGLVVNMCKEYPGPLAEYARYGIRQVHLPTPDVCEPSYESVLKGVYEILQYLEQPSGEGSNVVRGTASPASGQTRTKGTDRSSSEPSQTQTDGSLLDSKGDADASSANKAKRKVFIHCKAGRGRAATMALCYLIATSDLQPDEAMKLILSRRSVVEPGVRKFRVVRKFLQRLAHYDNDFDALYLHDGLLGGGN